MIMQAFHKTLGRYVEIVPGQMYDTHWNYYDLTHGVQVIRQGIPGVDLIFDNAQPQLPESWGEVQAAPSVATATDDKAIEQPSISNPTPGFVKLLNLNAETSSSVIALHLPGIGRATAKKICDRKPDGGYKDFDHLKSICSDFHLDAEAWEKVKELVEF